MNNRLISLDVYKGISIIAITLLHFENGVFTPLVSVFIGSFMIAAFYFCAGWVAGSRSDEYSEKEFLLKRVVALGKTYLWFSLIYIVFDIILLCFGYYDFKYLAREIYKTLTLRGIGTLWFLPALVLSELLFYFSKRKGFWWVVAIFVLAVIYRQYYNGIWMAKWRNTSDLMKIIDAPFRTISNVLGAFTTYSISYYAAKQYKKNEIKLTNSIKLVIMIGCLAAYIFSFFVNIRLGVIGGLLINYLLLVGMFILSYFLSKVSLLKDFFVFWGVNSLGMMVTHYSIILVLFEIFNYYCMKNQEFTGTITLYYFIVAFMLQYPIVNFINKKAKFLIGK
ncbi:MAG: hypothetical protein R3Y50_02055 [Rikenellaceae bacterium]